jgi:hypothetical protein
MDTSRLPEIVDATAALAAAFVPGVRSVAGAGTELVTIPAGGVMAGQLVPAFLGKPTESWQHVSNLPAATASFRSATVTEVEWDIPQRLYVQRVDEAELRRRLMPMYFAYLKAYSQHIQLFGLLAGAVARIRLSIEADADWAWLEIHLPLVERLNLENKS